MLDKHSTNYQLSSCPTSRIACCSHSECSALVTLHPKSLPIASTEVPATVDTHSSSALFCIIARPSPNSISNLFLVTYVVLVFLWESRMHLSLPEDPFPLRLPEHRAVSHLPRRELLSFAFCCLTQRHGRTGPHQASPPALWLCPLTCYAPLSTAVPHPSPAGPTRYQHCFYGPKWLVKTSILQPHPLCPRVSDRSKPWNSFFTLLFQTPSLIPAPMRTFAFSSVNSSKEIPPPNRESCLVQTLAALMNIHIKIMTEDTRVSLTG